MITYESHCSQLAEQAWEKIKSSKLVGSKKIGECPKIVFKKLDDTLNGMAYPDHIELNTSRLDSSDREVFLYKTTLHEIAHVAEYRISGVMTHGPLWHALDDLIDGDGLQFTNFRPKTSLWEETFVSFITVTVLCMMTIGGAALTMRFPVWWGYLTGSIISGLGIIGLFSGFLPAAHIQKEPVPGKSCNNVCCY